MRHAACVSRLLRRGAAPAAVCTSRTFAARAAALAAAPAAPPPPPSDAGLLRGAVAAAAAAALAGAASVAVAEPAPAAPAAAPASGGGGLLSHETRLRAFYDYERRLRARSTPDKVFEYFASQPAVPGEGRSMIPLDLLRAIIPVFPPYGSAALRSGSLPGEPGASAPVGGPALALATSSAHSRPAFFTRFDVEGDGLISFAEFIFFTTLLAIPPGEISAAFRMFDVDSSGSLDRDEFRAMMRVLRAQSRHGAAAGAKPARTGFADMPDAEQLDDACCSAFFFGKDGRGKLTLPKFEAFMKDLHAAIVSLEFAHYDAAGRGALSPADFGLSMVAAAGVSDVSALLSRVRSLEGGSVSSAPPLKAGAKPPPSYITPAQFAAFHALMPRLGELRRALMSYDASRGAVTPATLVGAAKRVCGIELAPSVVAVIFTVFDADGDGTLSPAEFIDVMARRRKMEGASGCEQPSLFDCCADCVTKWRDASN